MIIKNEMQRRTVMTNMKEKEESTKKEKMDFMATKATFVAGIVLVITIIKDIVELFVEIPMGVVICYILFSLLVFYIILGTKKFDEKLKKKQVSNFGNFLTIISIIVFVIENSYIRYKEVLNCADIIVIIFALGLTIGGAVYLLVSKY